MSKIRSLALALAGIFLVSNSRAISLDDIQLWTGSGTNRAALVVEWNPPIVLNNTTVPSPVANKTLVWGYRFNGTPTATQMFNAIVAANPQLYAVESVDPFFGTGVNAIGFNLNCAGLAGLSDGTTTNLPNSFTNNLLVNPSLNPDATYSLNSGDLFWSSDFNGPYWQIWNELGDAGGFSNSPNRGTNQYFNSSNYTHGQWAFANFGLDGLYLTNGSWIGLSIAPDGYPSDTNDPNYNTNMFIFNNDVQAPPSPDGNYVAYVSNPNDFASQVVSSANLSGTAPYNDPTAMLGRPTLKFLDALGSGNVHRTKIVEPPYWTTPDGSNDVLTEILTNGQVTVKMGRRIYGDANNPYGMDFIVYGNSFYSAHNTGGPASDATDLGVATLGTSFGGHAATISVSQDGTNWYALSNTPALFPDNAYRWDDPNHAWMDEPMNPNKPVNPSVYTTSFSGQTIASGLDQFFGAAGGTGYSIKGSGLPWIQYIQVQPGATPYTVIDAIAAVNPVTVGDVLSMTPDNLAAGISNLSFQSPANSSQNLISLNFDSLSAGAKISTVSLSDLSPFAPVTNLLSSAYQITVKPLTGTNAVSLTADVGLRTGASYNGNGVDLSVYQWNGSSWNRPPFTYNSATHKVQLTGLTSLSAFVITQLPPVTLALQPRTNGVVLSFIPVAGWQNTLERTTDFVTWTPLSTNTPGNTNAIIVTNTAPPAGGAYYRVRLNLP